VLLYRAKCYLNSKNVIDTLANLKQILDAKYDSRVFFDYHVLDALRECSDEEAVDFKAILAKIKETKKRSFTTGEQKFGNFVREPEYQFYKAVLYFHDKDYASASKNFERALKLTEEHIASRVSDSAELLEFYKLSYNNLPFNYVECLYNISLCELMSGNVLKGVKRLKLAIEKCAEGDTRNQLELFVAMLEKEMRAQFERSRQQPEHKSEEE
jgi:tetratricopeptide (TPR) repeat protein